MTRATREDDPQTIWGAAFRFANSQPPATLIGLVAIGFLVWLYMTVLQAMSIELRDHVQSDNWYQHQNCISLSILAGTSTELCTPNSNPDDRR